MTSQINSADAVIKSDAAISSSSAKPIKPTKSIKPVIFPRKLQTPSKQDKVIALLGRKNGVTLEEICTATDWQAHSVRGFLSGTCKKRMGLTVESFKNDKGVRRYRIVPDASDVADVSSAGTSK